MMDTKCVLTIQDSYFQDRGPPCKCATIERSATGISAPGRFDLLCDILDPGAFVQGVRTPGDTPWTSPRMARPIPDLGETVTRLSQT